MVSFLLLQYSALLRVCFRNKMIVCIENMFVSFFFFYRTVLVCNRCAIDWDSKYIGVANPEHTQAISLMYALPPSPPVAVLTEAEVTHHRYHHSFGGESFLWCGL